jgi:hypothetical protein
MHNIYIHINNGVDGRIILRWIFRKWGVEARTGSSLIRVWTLVNAVMKLQFP